MFGFLAPELEFINVHSDSFNVLQFPSFELELIKNRNFTQVKCESHTHKIEDRKERNKKKTLEAVNFQNHLFYYICLFVWKRQSKKSLMWDLVLTNRSQNCGRTIGQLNENVCEKKREFDSLLSVNLAENSKGNQKFVE